MYVLLPFSGALLALIFYFAIRGGFLPSTLTNTTPYGVAALGALVGMFSESAVLKLKQMADAVFTKSEQGKDTVLPAPKVSSISPSSGPAAGGTPVTITGTDFAAGAKVNIGGVAATVTGINKTSITATTPAHAAGAVDVEVVNPDNQKNTLTRVFTYTP